MNADHDADLGTDAADLMLADMLADERRRIAGNLRGSKAPICGFGDEVRRGHAELAVQVTGLGRHGAERRVHLRSLLRRLRLQEREEARDVGLSGLDGAEARSPEWRLKTLWISIVGAKTVRDFTQQDVHIIWKETWVEAPNFSDGVDATLNGPNFVSKARQVVSPRLDAHHLHADMPVAIGAHAASLSAMAFLQVWKRVPETEAVGRTKHVSGVAAREGQLRTRCGKALMQPSPLRGRDE